MSGRVLVLDASALFEVVADTPHSAAIRAVLREDEEQSAQGGHLEPHRQELDAIQRDLIDGRVTGF